MLCVLRVPCCPAKRELALAEAACSQCAAAKPEGNRGADWLCQQGPCNSGAICWCSQNEPGKEAQKCPPNFRFCPDLKARPVGRLPLPPDVYVPPTYQEDPDRGSK